MHVKSTAEVISTAQVRDYVQTAACDHTSKGHHVRSNLVPMYKTLQLVIPSRQGSIVVVSLGQGQMAAVWQSSMLCSTESCQVQRYGWMLCHYHQVLSIHCDSSLDL